MSANELWCAVSAPGDKKVFLYNRMLIESSTGESTYSTTGNGSQTQCVLDSWWAKINSSSELYIRINSTE